MTMKSPFITRRAALVGAAALPFVASAGKAMAAAEMLGMSTPKFNRFKMGEFEVTALLAGTRTVPNPQTIFGMNVSPEEFAAVSAANHIPDDAAQFFFTPTVVNTGSELILFDAGLQGPATVAALKAAGYQADQIDTVVITHMHGDHIGGLMTDGRPTFANARYVTGAVEYDATSKAENARFESNVRPLAEQMSMLDDGGSVASGVTAMAAFGHSPGHMAYRLESGGKQLVLGADFANHYVWSLAYPDWEVKFDRDKAAAAKTRRKMLDMMAADKVPFIGYHMPFPAVGFVETRGEGYHYVPAAHQMMMNG